MTTRDDDRLTDTPMVPVDCLRCGATVLARKSSRHQTSIQWSAAAYRTCAERLAAEPLSAYGPRGVFLACSSLRQSIGQAVQRGDVSVVDEVAVSSS